MIVRNWNPGPPESDSVIPAVPALKSASDPAHRDRLVPAVLFSNANFRTAWVAVSTGIPVTRYLPSAPTVPVIVNISDSPLQIGLLGAAARADVRALPGGATVPSAPVAARAFLPQVRSTSPGWQIHPPDRYVRTA